MADPVITWRIGVDDKVSRTLRGIDSQIAGLTRSFRTLGGLAGFASVTAGLSQLGAAALRLGSELQDASDKLGVSATELLRLKGAAEATGASFDQVQSALVFLAKTNGEATRGAKDASEAFRLLGLDAKKLAELPLDRRLAVVAAQLQQLPVGADRADLAVKVLGRGAADLLPLLGNLDEELKKVNTTLTDGQVKALDDALDRWEAFKRDAVDATASAMGRLLIQFDEFQKRASKSVVVRPGGGFDIQDTATLGQPRRPGASGRWGAPAMSPDEAAAIIGAPGRKDSEAAIANFRKAVDEFESLLARTRAPGEGASSRQALDQLEMLAEQQAYWNDELERAAGVIEDTKQPFDRYVERLTEINRLLNEGLISDQVATQARKDALNDLASSAEESATVVSSKTDEILGDIRNATEGFAKDIADVFFDTTQSIGEMFANLAEQIAKIFLQQAIIQPWLDALGGLFSGGGIDTIDMSKLPQRRAMGGPVAAGSPYLVGEQGPELFVPRQAGTVMPNGSVGGAVVVNFNVSSPDPRAAASMLLANEKAIVAVVNRAMLRAGRRPELAT